MPPLANSPQDSDPEPKDLAEKLIYVMGDSGSLQENMGGFKIKIIHERGFPWADICKVLAVRGFKLDVTLYKTGLYLNASL